MADPQWLDEHAASSYMYMPLHSSSVMGASTGAAVGASVAAASVFSANYGDFGAQLSSSFADVRNTISMAVPSPVAVSTAVAVVPAAVRSEDADMCDTHIRVAHGIRRKKG